MSSSVKSPIFAENEHIWCGFEDQHAMAFAIHKYFNDPWFYYLHTPIITGSDAERAGSYVRVTILDAKKSTSERRWEREFCRRIFSEKKPTSPFPAA